ncbi:peptide/nickel transport system substrate-binding protein [Erwinia toletana]|uniref:Peptide/nickel transport system substrate-binding protein n=1 Tax=Winslowiella toletana TaxID=92490 RepID=A0ABS4PFH4_9GAMM|nr:ABC transporter substrate-binding protein [Winslowiella toletana]MBP2171399.1 peptide/nickel transport system substrate-binding protein [Winslowiella toletana]
MKSVFSALFISVMLASGVNAAPQPGGTANLIVQPEPTGLMLGITTNSPSQLVGGNIYEGLLRYNGNLQPQPSLAKSWTISDDGLTYTFHLQEHVLFHDGQPMTSEDVLFSLNDFLMKTQPRHRSTMEHVSSVTAPDANTIIIKLKHPYEPFIRSFSFSAMPIVPEHIYKGTDYTTNPANEKPIGTGPFKFAEWQRGNFIKLVKNPDYYLKGRPYLDAVLYHIIPDGASRAVSYETGTVDILPGGSVENYDIPRLSALANTCTTEKGWEYTSPLSFLWLNNRVAPMNNVKFRQAIMYALDRDFARDALWNGYGKVATGPFSSKLPFYADVGAKYEHNPEKAKALLKEIGYNGKTLRLLPLPYGETWQRWAEAVKQNLAEVGIPVTIESADVAGWNQRVSSWDYDIAFTYMFQNGDPAIGVERNYISSQIAKGNPWNNVEGYSNPEVDQLFKQAAMAFPSAERQKLYSQVQAKLRDDVPVAWLLDLGFPTIYNCKYQDLITTANGLSDSLRDAWIKK